MLRCTCHQTGRLQVQHQNRQGTDKSVPLKELQKVPIRENYGTTGLPPGLMRVAVRHCRGDELRGGSRCLEF